MLTSSEGAVAQRRGHGRLLGAACLLCAEYLAISFTYDARPLIQQPGGLRWLGMLGRVAPSAIVVVVVLLVLFGTRMRLAWDGAVDRAPRRVVPRRWLAAHALSYAALWLLTDLMFSRVPTTFNAPAIAGWFASVLAVVASLLLALLPLRIWLELASELKTVLLAGIGVGIGAWAAGIASLLLWDPLGVGTLYGVALVLQLLVPDMVFDPAYAEVGSQRFYVRVDPACSGYEGIGVIVVYLTAYIWMARRELLFPRVWVLLPLAVVAVLAANILRIVALLLVGLTVSPEVALGGFHSKAGWLFSCAVGLGTVAWSRRSSWFSRESTVASADNPVSPFVVPLLCVIASALVTGLFATGFDRAYGMRVLVGGVALFAYRRRFPVANWTPSLEATGIGALVFVLWLALAGEPDAAALASMRSSLDGLGQLERSAWIILKLIGAIVIIPVVEERAFRGYLLRRLVDARFESVPWQRVTWLSVGVSSLAFGALHQQWIAGTMAGVLFAIIQARRGNFGEAVFAHAVSNALIAIWALGFGRLDLWA